MSGSEIEAHLPATARLQLRVACPAADQLRPTASAATVTLGVPPSRGVDNDAGGKTIVLAEEARQRRAGNERARDQHRRLSAAIAIAGGDGDGHHAERRQIVGDLGGGGRAAVRVGDDRTEEERRRLKPGAENIGAVAAAATPRSAPAFDALGNLRCHDRGLLASRMPRPRG